MTHEDAGHYAMKHPENTKPDERIAAAVKRNVSGGMISCAAAFKIADELKVTPAEIGTTIDLMEARIGKCQLGLYGYGPQRRIVTAADSVSEELEGDIRNLLTAGQLPCRSAWDIAGRHRIPKMNVSAACEKLGIKISTCQLGSFK